MSASTAPATMPPAQNTQNPPIPYEIHLNTAIPTGNFNEGTSVVRVILPQRGAYQNPRFLCGYLHLPNTDQLFNAIRSIEVFLDTFREAQARNWFPLGDARAGLKTTWNQLRLFPMFFPVKGNSSVCARFDIVRRNVGFNRPATLNDLRDASGSYLFSEVELPAVGQAMSVAQLMARLPNLFRNTVNIAAGASGQPIYDAEDINRASCLLRFARTPLHDNPARRRIIHNAISVEYAYPAGHIQAIGHGTQVEGEGGVHGDEAEKAREEQVDMEAEEAACILVRMSRGG